MRTYEDNVFPNVPFGDTRLVVGWLTRAMW